MNVPANLQPQRWMIAPGIGLGIAILFLSIALKPTVSVNTQTERARLVDVHTLQKTRVAPLIKGFGRAEPKHIWEAVAEVSGRLLYRNPQLERGRILEAGTPIIEIDPLEYELKLAKARANLSATQIQLKRIDQQEANVRSTLKIEQEQLRLATGEFKRFEQLVKEKLISNSEFEKEKQNLLQQQKSVQDLNNQLFLLADDKQVTSAQLKVEQANLNDAERQLEKTKLSMPFDARIAEVNIELDQVVNMQSTMLIAHNIDVMQVQAQVSMYDMKNLISSIKAFSQQGQLPSIDKLNLNASIRVNSSGLTFRWPALVTRISETINPDQATVGVYLEVKQNMRNIDLAVRPPLANGMFVEAHIHGFASEQFLVPERALHNNTIYRISTENTLEIIPIEVRFRSAQGVAISGAIKNGDRIVLNDLIPAIPGMALRTEAN